MSLIENNVRIKTNQSGFTILEVVTGIVLAGLLLSGFVVMINNVNVANDRTRDIVVTNAFVENKSEELRNAKFLGLPADGTIVDFTSEMPQSLALPRSATYEITDLSSSVKQVDFIVQYNDHGSTRTVNYSTAIGELGVGQY